jgi:hypothetical protein
LFFSEEKNQKTFASSRCSEILDVAGEIRAGTRKQKSFWFFFFRKRTSCFLYAIHGLAPDGSSMASPALLWL